MLRPGFPTFVIPYSENIAEQLTSESGTLVYSSLVGCAVAIHDLRISLGNKLDILRQ